MRSAPIALGAAFYFAINLNAPLSAQEVVLAPSGPWQLNADEEKCRIVQDYGEGDNRHVLYFEQYEPSGFFVWLAAGPSVAQFREGRDIEYKFGPNGEEGTAGFGEVIFGSYGPAVLAIGLITSTPKWVKSYRIPSRQEQPPAAPSDRDQAKTIETLTLSQRKRDDVVFQLASLDRALGAMDVCTADLVQSWGLDAEAISSAQSGVVVTNPAKVAKEIQNNLPEGAAPGKGALVSARIIVKSDGTIGDCEVMKRSVAKSYDVQKLVCGIIREEASFQPAIGADGAPIDDFYMLNIRYDW